MEPMVAFGSGKALVGLALPGRGQEAADGQPAPVHTHALAGARRRGWGRIGAALMVLFDGGRIVLAPSGSFRSLSTAKEAGGYQGWMVHRIVLGASLWRCGSSEFHSGNLYGQIDMQALVGFDEQVTLFYRKLKLS